MFLKHGLGLYKETGHRAHCCQSRPCSVLLFLPPLLPSCPHFPQGVGGERLGLDLVRCGSCLNVGGMLPIAV